MYYLKKSSDAEVRIFRSVGNQSSLIEPSSDEIARTLLLYHQALKTQLDILSQERSEKARLLQEVASLTEKLRAAESRTVDDRAMSVRPARTNEKLLARAQPLASKKLDLFRTLIDQNKQLREEIANG